MIMRRASLFSITFRTLLTIFAIPVLTIGVSGSEVYPDTGKKHVQDAETGEKKQDGYELLPTHRVVTGIVEAIVGEQAKVEFDKPGKMNPRFLSLNREEEKGFTL